MNQTKTSLVPLVGCLLTTLSLSSFASDDAEVINIRAERMSSELNTSSRSVSVISEQVLDQQFSTATNIAEVLAKIVPGMAPPNPALTNYSTTMRGRNALVLIDGVPMNTNRNISRDLHTLHPSQVALIEIFRGGNAMFGSGATGGVIYIHTKSGQKTQRNTTQIGLLSSLTQVDSDALSYQVAQSSSGQTGDWLYRVGASYEQTNGFYDAEGDRLAPEPSQGDNFDSDIYSLDAKLSKDWDNSSLMFSALWYNLDQDTDYAADPSVASQPYIIKGHAIRGLQLDDQNEVNNLVLNSKYQTQLNQNHSLTGQVYYRDYNSRFSPFDGRPYATWNHLAQTYLESSNLGLRLTLNSKLSERVELDWGLDANDERSEMPVTTYDGDAYDNSGGLVFISLGDKDFVPELSHKTTAIFAQTRVAFNPNWGLEGGLRYEQIDASFKSFVTLGSETPISGSSYDYDSLVYNLGLTYNINENHTIYAATNEGYELPDIGLQIRYANDQFDLSQSNLEPVETKDYELGWRGVVGSNRFSLAAYQSTSDLGRVTTENMGLSLSRNQVDIKGFEATASVDINTDWSLDLNYTYVDGEEKSQGSDAYAPMNGFSIPPSKISAIIGYSAQDWHSQLTLLQVAGDDYRIDGNNSFGRRDTESYTTVDWQSTVDLSTGQLMIGVENLFNNQYFSLYSQLQRNGNNTSSIPGRGRTLSVQYQFDW